MSGPPNPDPRVGLGAGLFDAEEAAWNLRVLSETPPSERFIGVTNSDLAFTGDYAIQGNYNGIQVWDLSTPRAPTLVTEYVCPASQSDVSVYGNLLFVSGEGLGGRLDCGTEGVEEAVSADRLRGIRIFDISDIRNPEYVANVQTCRGSHTHSVLKDPDDDENVYVYVSGSASVRPEEELPGCSSASPERGPELGAVPDRGDPGAAGAPRAGRHRELAPHLRRPGGAAGARPRLRGPRRARPREGAVGPSSRHPRRAGARAVAPSRGGIPGPDGRAARRHRRAHGRRQHRPPRGPA